MGPSFVTLKMHDSHAKQLVISHERHVNQDLYFVRVNIELHDVHAIKLINLMTFMKTKVGSV